MNKDDNDKSNAHRFQCIRLCGCCITHIDRGSFKGMDNLRSLDLSHNWMSRIPPLEDVEDTLTLLTLKWNRIRKVPENYFDNFTSITSFDISYNHIVEVTIDMFAKFQFMDHVTLMHNLVATVECGSFKNMSKLSRIDLSLNRLETFPCIHPLHPDACIHSLKLDHNDISNISEEYISGLKCLHQLYISGNKVENGSFVAAIPSVKEIRLSNNRMNQLLDDDCTLSRRPSFPNLLKAHFGHNDLTKFPCMADMPETSEIWLQRNRLSIFPRERMAVLVNVHVLHMEDNNATTFPDFSLLPEINKLRCISLQFNQIRSMPRHHVQTLHRLQYLGLAENNLVVLPDMTFVVGTLKTLTLHANQLLNVEPVIARNGGHWLITSWDVSNNNISSLEKELLQQMSSLHTLIATNNLITDFPFMAAVGKTLVKASLRQNYIIHVPAEYLSGMRVLQELDLTNNLLTYFPFENIGGMVDIRSLTLSYNYLSTIPYLSHLPSLPKLTVDIRYNCFNCTRHLCWMRYFDKFSLLREKYLCNEPPKLSGIVFNDLSDEELSCYCK